MKKKLIVCLLIVAMLLSVAACGGNGASADPSGNQEQTQQSVSNAEPLVLSEGGQTEFRIIYAENASKEVRATVDYLVEQLNQLTGATFKAMEDMAVSGSGDTKEILVGQTDRKASKAAIESMSGSGDYIVRVDGSKIVLAGMLDMGVQQAA